MSQLANFHTRAASSPYQLPDPLSVNLPEGLVALGGDLSPAMLLSAYLTGIFPWFGEDELIAWYSPDPRCVLYPKDFAPKKSLIATAKHHTTNSNIPYTITLNQAFDDVIHACSLPRVFGGEKVLQTWITDGMKNAYKTLHTLGAAHSIEVWAHEPTPLLIGGLYGIKLGGVFCGESMFYRRSDASKLAFWALNRLCLASQVQLIDCQLPNSHLRSLGARTLSKPAFIHELKRLTAVDYANVNWCQMPFEHSTDWLLTKSPQER